MAKRLPKGVLVVFEGIDGAGKTTQARALVESLCSSGYDAVYSKEPTDGPWGRKIRASAESERMPLAEELDAFLADRKEHCADFLIPALDAGRIVILDRYYYSTAAYQGERGANPDDILRVNEEFAPQPDALFILEIPIDVSMDRIRTRGYAVNQFEKKEALARCAEIFCAINRPYVRRIDGCRSIEEIAYDILIAIQEGPIRISEWSADAGKVSQETFFKIMSQVRRIQEDNSVPVSDKAEAVRAMALRELS